MPLEAMPAPAAWPDAADAVRQLAATLTSFADDGVMFKGWLLLKELAADG